MDSTVEEGPPARDRLSRERILAAAQELIDSGGPEQLSMRRLAQELDVWPMGIYRYFHDKEELVRALAEAAAEEISSPDESWSWRDRLQALLGQALVVHRRHPGALQATRLTEAAAAVLADGGISGSEAQRLSRLLLAYTAGSAALGLDQPEFEDGLNRLLDRSPA